MHTTNRKLYIVANQPYVIDVLRGTNRFANLLRSSNQEVVKYMAKTIAYLSLRNGKRHTYEPELTDN